MFQFRCFNKHWLKRKKLFIFYLAAASTPPSCITREKIIKMKIYWKMQPSKSDELCVEKTLQKALHNEKRMKEPREKVVWQEKYVFLRCNSKSRKSDALSGTRKKFKLFWRRVMNVVCRKSLSFLQSVKNENPCRLRMRWFSF